MAGKRFEQLSVADFVNCEAVVDEDGELYAIGGIEVHTDEQDIIWLLCTYLVEEHPIKFLKGILALHKRNLELHPKLWNVVWLGNPKHIEWLKWLGARFGKLHDINGEKFQYFEFERSKN